MRRIALGDRVSFTTTTGRQSTGHVVELILERRQPTMVLIERADGGRAIRLEHEVVSLEVGEVAAVAG